MWIDDEVLLTCREQLGIKLWIPEHPMVVLGRSNCASLEVRRDTCERDSIEVLKRLGGGGTVLLHDGCLVIGIGCWVRDYFRNEHYFKLLNQSIIDVLHGVNGDIEFLQRGHSDIVIGNRKIAGTSLFRSRNYLLFQASILVRSEIEAIEAYLAHPSKEPDYRQGRSHRSFLSCLKEFTELDCQEWQSVFEKNLRPSLLRNLQGELVEPQLTQMEHILSRIGEVHPIEVGTS